MLLVLSSIDCHLVCKQDYCQGEFHMSSCKKMFDWAETVPCKPMANYNQCNVACCEESPLLSCRLMHQDKNLCSRNFVQPSFYLTVPHYWPIVAHLEYEMLVRTKCILNLSQLLVYRLHLSFLCSPLFSSTTLQRKRIQLPRRIHGTLSKLRRHG